MMEPELLADLIERHAAALTLYARQWCAICEDVVQEAFVKLAAQRPVPKNCRAWLYCVVRHGALSAGRAESRRKKHETKAAHVEEPWFQVGEDNLVDAEEATQVLQKLPPEQREIIVAHLWGDLTFEEIAEVVGCSTSTAHRRYLAGLTHLRERLVIVCPSMNRENPNGSKPS